MSKTKIDPRVFRRAAANIEKIAKRNIRLRQSGSWVFSSCAEILIADGYGEKARDHLAWFAARFKPWRAKTYWWNPYAHEERILALHLAAEVAKDEAKQKKRKKA